MSKRNKQKPEKRAKKNRTVRSPFGWMRARQPDPAVFATQAGVLIQAGRPDEALELLEPLLEDYPRSPEIIGTAAVAYMHVDDLWAAMACFERVQQIQPQPVVWATLASIYIQADMTTYAIDAIKNARKGMHDADDQVTLATMLEPLEREHARLMQTIGIGSSPKQIESGLRHYDDAKRALGQFDLQAAIDANRRAIRFLGNWPPVHNNLAQALFYNGQPAEALATTNSILAQHPDNLHALSNGIKFLAWSGKMDEARTMWEHLQPLEPTSDNDVLKLAEAAAIMNEHEIVHQLLKPLVDAGKQNESMMGWQILFRFTVAEANTGRTKSALKHIKELGEDDPSVELMLEALKAKQPGVGWSTSYPYFTMNEVLPLENFNEIATLLASEDQLDDAQFRKRMDRFFQRFPQLLLIGKKLIWELQQPDFGTALLDMVGTAEAHAILEEFGFSQVGSDEARMDALLCLKEAGMLSPDQPVRIWSNGAWQEVRLISYEISDEVEVTYSPKTVRIYERARDAFHQGDYVQSERLLKEVIALEPRAADAYFNLAATYAARGDVEQAKAMCYKALEIKPLYAMPRCQLAQILLYDGEVEAAKAMLLPLNDATRLSTIEASMYMYTQAQILIKDKDFDKAEGLLESLIVVNPDFAPAYDLLERLPMLEMAETGLNWFFEGMRQRQSNRRLAQQTKIKTLDVTVDRALGIFTRETQKSMAYNILVGGGWSTLKKKDLHERLLTTLIEGDTLPALVEDLSKNERSALRAVLKQDGVMLWEAFDKKYGNDLDENPDWQYHAPTSLMGRLRQRALLSVATVKDQTYVVVPVELRQPLGKLL